MTILLCRHAQSPENLYGKGACAGLTQLEIPLTEEGERQAAMLGEQIVDWCRSHETSNLEIKTSPYKRVRETAKIVEAALTGAGIEFDQTVDSRLGEVDFLPRGAELKEGYTLFTDRVLALENVSEVERRLKTIGDTITARENAATTLVITHSTPMRGLAALLAGKPFAAIDQFPRPDNCALWQTEAGSLPRALFAGFAPPARIEAPEDLAGNRRLLP